MLGFLARKRGSLLALTLAGLLALAPAVAEARMGGGGSFGSRGGRTWSAPPSTRTMPGATSSFDRSVTPRTAPGYNGGYMGQPGYAGSSFGRGFMGGLAGGLLGSPTATRRRRSASAARRSATPLAADRPSGRRVRSRASAVLAAGTERVRRRRRRSSWSRRTSTPSNVCSARCRPPIAARILARCA
jgi:hypothetical protein